MGEVGTAFGGVPAPDPLAQFLGRVVAWSAPGEPDTYVNIHGFTPKTEAATRQFPRKGGGRAYTSMVEYGQMQQFLWLLDQAGDEAFFCISTRSGFKGTDKQGNRKATRAKAVNRAVRLKAFVLDLDIKPKGYRSQHEALAAALPFFDGLGIEPTIVDTGVGLHLYPTLAVGITPAEWQPLANALIEAAKHAGLKFDVAVTRDDDRILRVPGSRNLKDPANPKVCRLLKLGTDVQLEHLRAVLAPFMGRTPASPRANGHAPLDLSFLPPRPPITGPEAERARADVERLRVVTSIDHLIGACPVIKDAEWRGGDGDPEPLWKEFANLCHYVENGRDFFHDLSSDDPRYDEDATDQKYDERVLMGWPLCATIAAASPAAEAICKTCPMYGKGQSPIHAATRGDPPGEAHGGQVNGHANPAILSAAPFVTADGELVRPIWLPEACIYTPDKFIRLPDGRPVFHTPVLHIGAYYDTDGVLFFEFTILRGTTDVIDQITFEIPAAATASPVKFAEATHRYGLFPNRAIKDYDFMTDLQTMIREKRLAVSRVRTGWLKNEKKFSFGGHLYTADGRTPNAMPDIPYLIPEGNVDEWREAANVYVGKGLTEMEIIIACGYTGPLVQFSGVEGVILFVHSETGRGKSAAAWAGCTVAADPEALVKSMASNKGGLHRIMAFNNIPVFFDELVPDDTPHVRDFAQLLKTATSGQDALRLKQSGTTEQKILTASNQVVGLGNRRLTEIAKAADTNAQAARVVEFEMPDKIEMAGITQADVSRIKDALRRNHGVAMQFYIDFVVRHYDAVQQMVGDTLDYLSRTLNAPKAARFWLAQLAVIMVAIRIARKLNLHMFNVPAIDQFLLDWFRRNRDEVFGAESSSDNIELHLDRMRGFYNDNFKKRIITDVLPTRGRIDTKVHNSGMLIGLIKPTIRIAVQDKRMYASWSEFRQWCKERNMSAEHSKSVLITNGVCLFHRKGKSIGGNTSYYTAPEAVFDFNLDDPRNVGFVPEKHEF